MDILSSILLKGVIFNVAEDAPESICMKDKKANIIGKDFLIF